MVGIVGKISTFQPQGPGFDPWFCWDLNIKFVPPSILPKLALSFLSLRRRLMGISICWELTSDGLVSHSGVVKNTLIRLIRVWKQRVENTKFLYYILGPQPATTGSSTCIKNDLLSKKRYSRWKPLVLSWYFPNFWEWFNTTFPKITMCNYCASRTSTSVTLRW